MGLPARAKSLRLPPGHPEGRGAGPEVLSSQQLYYRLLAASHSLKPVLPGPGRVALVGEALRDLGSTLPKPGEARLFARAIAEAKRSGVKPEEIPKQSPEAERLRQVYARYEELKNNWGRWDYDDFRAGALGLLTQASVRLEPDLVVVDGFREAGGAGVAAVAGTVASCSGLGQLARSPAGVRSR